MTPVEIDRVFGRSRLRMTTGEHVEVFREEAREGEGRRYTKRFLETASGDFRPWTEREWRILARLGERGDAAVAKVVRFFPADDDGGTARLETRDAGPTVDQWAALVPLRRTAPVLPDVFGDCAHWWALARQCLLAFEPLHALGFVHLDFKADNVCIPWRPAQAARPVAGEPLAPDFEGLALIDVAFSLLPEVELPAPLPLAREPGYEYQSPRLLQALDEGRRGNVAATLELDWRADIFSLAALLWRSLPELDDAGTGWTSQRHAAATAFVRRLLDIHDAPLPVERPHRGLIAQAALRLNDPQLAAALQATSSFDPDRAWRQRTEATPLTRVVATRPMAAQGRLEPAFAPRAPAVAEVDIPVPMPDDDDATQARFAAAAPVASGAATVAAAATAAPPRSAAAATVAAPSASSVVAAAGGAAESAPPAAPKLVPASAAPMASSAPKAVAERVGDGAATARWAPPWLARPAPRVAGPSAPAAAAAGPPPASSSSAKPAAPSVAQAAPPAVAKAAPPSVAKAAPPIVARPALQPLDRPTPTSVTDGGRPVAASAPPSPHELPRRPAGTPVPVLAAAGVGALLVALAAWWGLDGRAMFERMAARRAAPAPSAAATVESRPATAAAAVGATTAAAPPATAAAPPTPAAATATGAPPPASPEPTMAAASDFESAAGEWMKSRLPRVAQTARRQLAPVLAAASRSAELRRRGEVRAAMQATRSSGAAAPGVQLDAPRARDLNEAAMATYWRDNNVADAVRLQTQAFGANPLDPEIAGNLAFLRLRERPPQAEAARQLALHALTLKDARFPTGRIEDWTTLAIADALTGRDSDARNAWFVSMALAADLQRQCNAAVRAQAIYGERLRPSVQAMLRRARSSAAYGRCEVAQTAKQAAAQKAAAEQPQATRKPTRKTAGKGKSTPRTRRTIP